MGRDVRQPTGPLIGYRQATLADATHVGSNLREQDYIEAYLQSHGKAPVEAVRDTFKKSRVALAAHLEDRPIAVFGVCVQEERASPWMVATPEADRFPKEMVAFGRQFVGAWLHEWPMLFNWVYSENSKSIRWLKHLGFIVEGPRPVGLNGAPFCLFYQYRTNPNVC